ncbi:hypothetical protein Shyhy01_15250 [Streptomyces hygroscopicus subsp. hygroscopicus]|nr:hypothetical protein Shyhy01_15250 [Streptomyces hygroscopicus subsp. hygroscopicus]
MPSMAASVHPVGAAPFPHGRNGAVDVLRPRLPKAGTGSGRWPAKAMAWIRSGPGA